MRSGGKNGTCEDEKTCGDASSFAKASTFAEATVDESEDKEAAAGQGRDEAADEGRWAKSLFAADIDDGVRKARKKKSW